MIQNNISFGALKISPDKITKRAVTQYVDCMDTARVMRNSLDKIDLETGLTPVIIKGEIIPDAKDATGKNFSILFKAFNGKDEQDALSKIAVEKGDFQSSRANLFEKFADEIITKIKTVINR